MVKVCGIIGTSKIEFFNFSGTERVNYKQFVLQFDIDEFRKDPNSTKCCCNKYSNFFKNSYYDLITTRDLNIVNNQKLCRVKS